MALSVELQSIEGFAVSPSDISIGEAASIESQIVTASGDLISVALKRFTIEISLKGVLSERTAGFVLKAEQNRLSLLSGRIPSSSSASGGPGSVGVGGFELITPALTKATPSGYLEIDRTSLTESLSLTYEDMVYR